MAPKSASAAGKEKLIGDEDEVLQAIILADSFNKRFKPLTTDKPRCLLPICNAPLLEWTFESLVLAGVQEIFVICRSHAEQVKAAIKASKWSRPGSGIKITAIMTAKETYSPGDAMRDVYTRGLVTTDFVLVAGDLVSNVRIDEVVKVHKERRKTNKDAIMTMVVKESGATHRTRGIGEASIFVLDANTSECLHYEPVPGHPRKNAISVPRELLVEHPEIDIRNDLIDCCIDVCSVEVPSLFQDNFDYLDLRRDFVHGVLTSDLLMKNIYCYVLKDGYAARVKDTKSYDAVSKDILARWTFPLVPDDNHPGGHEYEHLRGNKYIAKGNTVILSRTCKIGNNTLIGGHTQIFDNAFVTGSVIGKQCLIGTGTTVKNAYIFDGATIGQDCVIEECIIGAGAKIKDGSTIPRGCLIGDHVILGPNCTLVPFERLSRKPGEDVQEDGEEESEESHDGEDEGSTEEDEEEPDSDIEALEKIDQTPFIRTLGLASNALVWPRGPLLGDEEEEEDESPESFANQKLMWIGDHGSDLSSSDAGTDSDDDSSTDSSDDDFAHEDTVDTSRLADSSGNEFITEVQLSLERAFSEGHSVDNAAVELKTLRMASNVSLTRVREAVISAIVEKIPIVEGNPAEQRKVISEVTKRWGQLINKIGGVNGVETLSILQAHCASSKRLPMFGQILIGLYQDDIVEENEIRQWHALPESKGQGLSSETEIENYKRCWLIGGRMIQQFDEQESDSEEDDDDEDEDDGAEDKKKPPHAKKESEDGSEESSEDGAESEEGSESEADDAGRELVSKAPANSQQPTVLDTTQIESEEPDQKLEGEASAGSKVDDGSEEESEESDEDQELEGQDTTGGRTLESDQNQAPESNIGSKDDDPEDESKATTGSQALDSKDPSAPEPHPVESKVAVESKHVEESEESEDDDDSQADSEDGDGNPDVESKDGSSAKPEDKPEVANAVVEATVEGDGSGEESDDSDESEEDVEESKVETKHAEGSTVKAAAPDIENKTEGEGVDLESKTGVSIPPGSAPKVDSDESEEESEEEDESEVESNVNGGGVESSVDPKVDDKGRPPAQSSHPGGTPHVESSSGEEDEESDEYESE